MKSIKPARLRDKDMRLTLLNAMRKAATPIKKDLAKPTSNWHHKVKFDVLVSLTGSGPVVYVYTEDQIYQWINEGTGDKGDKSGPGYPIFAGYYTGKSDKKVLAFPSMSTPKTKPGSMEAGPGSSGPIDVHVPYVTHHGVKPRDFTGQVRKEREPWFKRQMEAAMRETRNKSGNPA